MTPESALEFVPGFSEASVGIMFADGATAKTFLVENLSNRFVLRVDKPAAAELGLDRAGEEEICRLVAAAGISPSPVFFDHERGIHLRQFVPGMNWVKSDLHIKYNLKRLAAMLNTCHKLPAVSVRFDPRRAVHYYQQRLATIEADQLANTALGWLDELALMEAPECLCHNDLLNHNILEAEDGVLLIDWEFGGMGDPFFDLAVVAGHHELPERLTRTFLKYYLDRRPTPGEMQRLGMQRQLYACLLDLWYLMFGRPPEPVEDDGQ